MATLSTFVSLPVSIPLDAVSLAGASVSGVTTALTKKYQKKQTKVMKLVDIVKSAISVFETSISKVLNNEIDERQFQVLQELHLTVINEQANFTRKMEAKNRNHFQKSLLEAMKEHKNTVRDA